MQLGKYMNIPSKTIAAALLIVSFAWFASPVKSEIIVIDNFNTTMGKGILRVSPFQTTDVQTAETSGAVKGNPITRDITLNLQTSPNPFLEANAFIFGDKFAWSNDTDVASDVTLNHQFTPINVLSPYGSEHGSVILDVLAVDLGANATITLVDSNDQSATFSQSVTAGGAQQLTFNYDDFLSINSSLDLTQIKSVTTKLSQDSGATAVDFQMDVLIFNTPEPSSIMLFSLAGIGFASRRRRKQS